MYVKYFKFKAKPFGLNPDPKFFYNSHTHKRALSCLGCGLGQGQGFVVITGEPGTGKTTLMSALNYMLAQTNIITARIINTQLQSDEMLRYVVAELGLPYEELSKVTLLKSLESFLQDCRSRGQRIIVIIDEAQNLSNSALEELRMIMNLVDGNEAVIQFVLLGQTRLQELLYSEVFESLRQRIVTIYHLEALSEEETKAYVIQRLRTVDWIGDPDFSPGAFITIYEQTHGIPAKINMLCGKVLQAACLNDSHEITEKDVLSMTMEMNNRFSEDVFSSSVVEGTINAFMETRTRRSANDNSEALGANPPDHKEETREELTQPFDSLNEEEIELIDIKSEPRDVPLLSNQITIDQALIEANSLQSDEELDSEIENWLHQQKQHIKKSTQNQLLSYNNRTRPAEMKESVTGDHKYPLEKLHHDDLEKTIEDDTF